MVATAADSRLKERSVDACQEFLRHFEAEGDGFLARIVTGDKTSGALPPAGKQDSEQELALLVVTKTDEVQQSTIYREGEADSPLG